MTARRVVDLERDAGPRAGGVAHLDLVDQRPLRGIGELERGAPGLEDGDLRVARTRERRLLGQPEGVAVEATAAS